MSNFWDAVHIESRIINKYLEFSIIDETIATDMKTKLSDNKTNSEYLCSEARVNI